MERESDKFNLITIVETTFFIKAAKKCLQDEEIGGLKNYLAANPEVGDIIPGLHGIRKMRWQANQKGKRGGARIVYFFYNFTIPLFLLDVYPKAKKDDLTSSDKKELNNLVDELLEQYGA